MSRASSLHANQKFEDFFCRVSCHGQRTWTVNWKMYIFANLCSMCSTSPPSVASEQAIERMKNGQLDVLRRREDHPWQFNGVPGVMLAWPRP